MPKSQEQEDIMTDEYQMNSQTGTPEDMLLHCAREIADISQQWGHQLTSFEREKDIVSVLLKYKDPAEEGMREMGYKEVQSQHVNNICPSCGAEIGVAATTCVCSGSSADPAEPSQEQPEEWVPCNRENAERSRSRFVSGGSKWGPWGSVPPTNTYNGRYWQHERRKPQRDSEEWQTCPVCKSPTRITKDVEVCTNPKCALYGGEPSVPGEWQNLSSQEREGYVYFRGEYLPRQTPPQEERVLPIGSLTESVKYHLSQAAHLIDEIHASGAAVAGEE